MLSEYCYENEREHGKLGNDATKWTVGIDKQSYSLGKVNDSVNDSSIFYACFKQVLVWDSISAVVSVFSYMFYTYLGAKYAFT